MIDVALRVRNGSLHTSELKDKNFQILFLVTGQRNQLKYAQMVLQVQGLVLFK